MCRLCSRVALSGSSYKGISSGSTSSPRAINQLRMHTHLSHSSSLNAANRNLSSAKYHSSSLLVQVKLLDKDFIQEDGFLTNISSASTGFESACSIMVIKWCYWFSSVTCFLISWRILWLITRFSGKAVMSIGLRIPPGGEPIYLFGDSLRSLTFESLRGEGLGIKCLLLPAPPSNKLFVGVKWDLDLNLLVLLVWKEPSGLCSPSRKD